MERRHTKGLPPAIIEDPKHKALAEAENGVAQLKKAHEFIAYYVDPTCPQKFRLTTAIILELHKIAIEGIEVFAGTFRNGTVK